MLISHHLQKSLAVLPNPQVPKNSHSTRQTRNKLDTFIAEIDSQRRISDYPNGFSEYYANLCRDNAYTTQRKNELTTKIYRLGRELEHDLKTKKLATKISAVAIPGFLVLPLAFGFLFSPSIGIYEGLTAGAILLATGQTISSYDYSSHQKDLDWQETVTEYRLLENSQILRAPQEDIIKSGKGKSEYELVSQTHSPLSTQDRNLLIKGLQKLRGDNFTTRYLSLIGLDNRYDRWNNRGLRYLKKLSHSSNPTVSRLSKDILYLHPEKTDSPQVANAFLQDVFETLLDNGEHGIAPALLSLLNKLPQDDTTKITYYLNGLWEMLKKELPPKEISVTMQAIFETYFQLTQSGLLNDNNFMLKRCGKVAITVASLGNFSSLHAALSAYGSALLHDKPYSYDPADNKALLSISSYLLHKLHLKVNPREKAAHMYISEGLALCKSRAYQGSGNKILSSKEKIHKLAKIFDKLSQVLELSESHDPAELRAAILNVTTPSSRNETPAKKIKVGDSFVKIGDFTVPKRKSKLAQYLSPTRNR